MKTRYSRSMSILSRGAAIGLMFTAVGAVASGEAVSAEETDANAPTACQLNELKVPEAGLDNHISAIDPTGTYIVGHSGNNAKETRSWLWHDGEAQYLDVPSDPSKLSAINSFGVGVGYSSADEGKNRVWIYEDGDFKELPDLGGVPRDINENGDFIGNDGQPYVVPAGQKEPTYLDLPDEALEGSARSINDDGTVVGRIETGSPEEPDYEPYLWDADGNGMKLPWPDGYEDAFGYAQSIQGDWITGLVHVKGMKWHYTPQDGATAYIVEGLDSPTDTTPNNVTVGTYRMDDDIYQRARMVTPDGNVELTGIDGAKTGTVAEYVSADATVVAGTSSPMNDVKHAVSWTCE